MERKEWILVCSVLIAELFPFVKSRERKKTCKTLYKIANIKVRN